ncbi:MAG TPA: hypothetical protein VHT29_11410 [Solirubrobacteraceae bacterium]|nr:hypothetical protein [Solirubrobacteraceae bacterium]
MESMRFRGKALLILAGLLVCVWGVGAARGEGPATDLVPVAPPALTYVTGTARSLPAVWVAQADGSSPVRLGPGLDPVISPNGQAVAAGLFGTTANSEQGPALGIYATGETGKLLGEYLSLAAVTVTPLVWSPDSRYLAVAVQSTAVRNAGARSGLAVIDTTSGTVTTIAHGQIYGASFAPGTSDRLVFARAPSLLLSAPTDLYTSMPDGSGLKQLTHDGRSLYPTWGARSIAYDRERPRRNDASVFQIWITPTNGGRSHRLTDLPARPLVSGLVPLAFSEDGSRLLAQYKGQDTSEAWTVRVPSGRARRITVHGQPVQAAGLSRDGSTVLVNEKGFEGPPSEGRVAAIPFAGGRPRVLVAHGSQAGWNR